MPDTDGAPMKANQDMILGEMRGQLREVVHSMNSLTQKFDSLTREVVGLAVLGPTVATLERRMTALEVERNRRDGAVGIAEMLVKSPLIGWFVGLASVGFALVKGWVKIP